jgi:hypothetical protein
MVSILGVCRKRTEVRILLENGKTIKHATSENSKFGSCGSVDNCGSSVGKYLGSAANLGPAVFRISIMDSAPLANSAPSSYLALAASLSNLAMAALSSNLAPAAPSANLAASVPLAPAARSANLAPAARSANSATAAKSARSANAARLHRQMWHLRLIGWQIRLGWQIWLPRQFIGNSVCKFGSVGNWAASAIRLRRRLRLQIRLRQQIWLRRQFIGNSAPPAAPSTNSDPYPSSIRPHHQFGCIGGSIGKFGSAGTSSRIRLHQHFSCIGKFVGK